MQVWSNHSLFTYVIQEYLKLCCVKMKTFMCTNGCASLNIYKCMPYSLRWNSSISCNFYLFIFFFFFWEMKLQIHTDLIYVFISQEKMWPLFITAPLTCHRILIIRILQNAMVCLSACCHKVAPSQIRYHDRSIMLLLVK